MSACTILGINVVEEMRQNLDHLVALRGACLRLLASPDGAGLDVGPHDFDLEVVVSTGAGGPVCRPLREFLGADGPRLVAVHAKMADPRPLLLATLAQIRQQIELMVKLSERIYNTQTVQQFQEEIIHAVQEVDTVTAARIRERLRSRPALPGAPGSSGSDG
jgi:hypothetical protein